jgi:hypothetical protein
LLGRMLSLGSEATEEEVESVIRKGELENRAVDHVESPADHVENGEDEKGELENCATGHVENPADHVESEEDAIEHHNADHVESEEDEIEHRNADHVENDEDEIEHPTHKRQKCD